ncbi:MAG: hypothetical protein ACKO7X_02205, partial [Bacteroidota bacterium]
MIVGAGLAGTIMGRTLERQGIPIQIWDQPNLGSASRVAAGIYCPINFHRLIPGWRAEEAVPKMLDFFGQEERYFGIPLMSHVPYWKPLTEEEQVAHWRRKMEEYPDWLDMNEGDQEDQAMKRICPIGRRGFTMPLLLCPAAIWNLCAAWPIPFIAPCGWPY